MNKPLIPQVEIPKKGWMTDWYEYILYGKEGNKYGGKFHVGQPSKENHDF